MLTARVPATSANLGPGFDSMGLALDWYDEVSLEPADELRFELSGEGALDVPRSEKHLVVRTIRAGLVELGHPEPDCGFVLRAHNTIPHSRGLGSSAAAIGAGLALAWGLARPGEELDREWLVERSSRLEGHPDNAAAVIVGGAVVAWMTDEIVDHAPLRVHPEIRAQVWVPATTLRTAAARRALPETLARADVVAQAARSALLVHALAEEPEHLMTATQDWLHTEQRAPLMPGSDRLRRDLRAAGVPAVVSGAGTTILALGTEQQLDRCVLVDDEGFTTRRLALGRGVELFSV